MLNDKDDCLRHKRIIQNGRHYSLYRLIFIGHLAAWGVSRKNFLLGWLKTSSGGS
jgi:hypothetical protein